MGGCTQDSRVVLKCRRMDLYTGEGKRPGEIGDVLRHRLKQFLAGCRNTPADNAGFRVEYIDQISKYPGNMAAGFPPNVKSIEGEFIKGFSGGVSGDGGVDAGLYTLYLTR